MCNAVLHVYVLCQVPCILHLTDEIKMQVSDTTTLLDPSEWLSHQFLYETLKTKRRHSTCLIKFLCCETTWWCQSSSPQTGSHCTTTHVAIGTLVANPGRVQGLARRLTALSCLQVRALTC